MNFTKSLFYVIIVSLALASCKSKLKDNEDITPAQELYSKGIKELESGEYKKASAEFEKVFFQHPGNTITPQAELMQAYSLYLAGEYEESADILDIIAGI